MRVVVAPDSFTGTLTAVQAAAAMADGWRRGAPHDEVVVVPMSDGGPGFVDVLHAALGGHLLAVTVVGPLGDAVPATVLMVGTDAYIEAAQACGLGLVPPAGRDVWRATTAGVGQLIGVAVDAGARRVVIGLGGAATNDGGAGLLAGLGGEPADALSAGPAAFGGIDRLDLSTARRRIAGVELVAAADVDTPLLGLRGAANLYGGRKGALAAELPALDAALARLVDLVGEAAGGATGPPDSTDVKAGDVKAGDVKAGDVKAADAKGAGAGGGLGYALKVLGARLEPALPTVAALVGLTSAVDGAGLVLTGEGAFDWQSMRGTVVSGVAAACGAAGAVCVVLAGRVDVGRREMNANGIEAAYAMVDLPGGSEAALGQADLTLSRLAERTARNWSRAPH